jgi:hypothetical protein
MCLAEIGLCVEPPWPYGIPAKQQFLDGYRELTGRRVAVETGLAVILFLVSIQVFDDEFERLGSPGTKPCHR